jgi:Uma2 family endonuclease
MDLDKLIEAENTRAGAQLLNRPSWSIEEFLKLPEAACRMELVDGSLLMLAAPGSHHQRAVRNLTNLLEAAAPGGWEAIFRVGLKLGPATLLCPDVIVVTRTAPEFSAPGETVLVAEIESPGTMQVDRLLKPGLYAEAGIEWYVRVELERPGSPAPTVTVYRLEDGAYVEHSHVAAGEALCLTEPVEVSFDPALLLSRELRRPVSL